MHQILKRNGLVAVFDAAKIKKAIGAAYCDVRGCLIDEEIDQVTDQIVARLDAKYTDSTPTVENVQDIVETVLMEAGMIDVAKAYIIYRYEHTKARTEKQEEVVREVEEKSFMIVKRSGDSVKYDEKKVRRFVGYFVHGIEKEVSVDEVFEQLRMELFEGMKTTDIMRALLMVIRARIERDPAYSKLAARILQHQNYVEVIGHDVIDYSKIDTQLAEAFIKGIEEGIACGRIDGELLAFDLPALAAYLRHEEDDRFEFLGLQTLVDRYFVRNDDTKRTLETPQMFWMRVAMGTAMLEEDKNGWAKRFYDIMADFSYTPSTPTLFHAGTIRPQLSSCYLNMVPDTLDGIYKSYADNAQLSKYSGGIGTAWSHLRAAGAFIKGTGVEGNGVIPFLKIANDSTVAINRSGRRRGAAAVYLENWHYDFPDFLELRKNTGDERRRTHDIDTAAWVSDLFMQRVRDGGEWTLFTPDETPELTELYGSRFKEQYEEYEQMARDGKIKLYKTMPAVDLWRKMLAMLFETGHPWITFKDPSNIRSPQDHVGVVHSSNLCTEITLNTSENETAVCNLGSINMVSFVHNGKFDADHVQRVVSVAMRMLDNVIDINFYPTEDAKRSNMRHRPVGLGIRGYHDALYEMDINYDSPEMLAFADESMEIISYNAILGSAMLAKERGAYQTFKESKWDRGMLPQDSLSLLEKERGEKIAIDANKRGGKLDWTPVREAIKLYGMRNSNTMAIAPTATTANIVGSYPSIEPAYKNLYVKANQAGDFIVINTYLVADLKKIGLWNKQMIEAIKFKDGSIQDIDGIPAEIKAKYKECFELESKWLVMSTALRAKWIDQSQSLNLFFRGTSGRELSELYFFIWETGLKTTYYLRTLGATQVEKSTVNTNEYGSTHLRDFSKKSVNSSTSFAPEVVKMPMITDEMRRRAESGEVAVCESCEG